MHQFFIARIRSFQYAFAGWQHLIRTQPNAWIHALATACVVLMAAWLQLPAQSWAILILTICCVWMAEALNSAIEAIVDLASPQKHPLAKASKDMAAAAVLIAAVSSVIIGFLVMGPPLLAKLTAM